MIHTQPTYHASACTVFKKTKETFGELSNMVANFPLVVNDIPIKTSEALYQLCRFPEAPNIQREIVEQASPMGVKLKSKKYKSSTRNDLMDVREEIMWWCLKVKLACNIDRFGKVLEDTGNNPIVEDSHRDRFWGAVRSKENPDILIGENKLGKLLMKLRALYREGVHKRLPPLNL
ncbi:MAG: NADAR family protein [Tannerellaceae bacterium]|jgi:ribA/ribD-fused uncharacterized protein|nr:NADAR family protein [Tannerellaceae bacterium]